MVEHAFKKKNGLTWCFAQCRINGKSPLQLTRITSSDQMLQDGPGTLALEVLHSYLNFRSVAQLLVDFHKAARCIGGLHILLASATGENGTVIWSTGGWRIEALDCSILGDIDDRKVRTTGRCPETIRDVKTWQSTGVGSNFRICEDVS